MSQIDSALVSIVCPIFKPNIVYFKTLLDSINNQTYKNIELILSLDLSDENIFSLIQNIELEVKIVTNTSTNPGIFTNLNNAIQYASGEFIQIFCQDDLMYSDFIENQLLHFEKNCNIGLVFSQFDFINEKDEIKRLESKFNYRLEWPDFFNRSTALLHLFFYGCMPGNLSPVMLRSTVIKEVGFFNPSYPYAGDFEYWIRVAEKYPFYFIKKTGLAIRRHPTQASKTIGNNILLHDLNRIYGNLSYKLFQYNSKIEIFLFLNESIGRQFAYSILKNIFRFNFKEAIYTFKEFSGLFNFWISFLFIFFTFNGRLKLSHLYGKCFK